MNLLVPVDELADALLDADTRPKPQHAPRAREIGIRQPHVPWLIGVALDPRLLAQRRGNERDQAIQPHPRPPPGPHRGAKGAPEGPHPPPPPPPKTPGPPRPGRRGNWGGGGAGAAGS